MLKNILILVVDKTIERVVDIVIDTIHTYLDGLCNGFGE